MKKIYYAIAVLFIFLSACKKETSVKEEQSQDNPGNVITYHLKNGGQVTAQINSKGEYVVGGDVILSKDQIAYLEYNKVGNGKETTPRSTFTAEFQKLWTDGIVYYTVNDPTNSSSIATAINHWEANTPIRFIQRTNQTNYVDFSGAPSQGGGSSQLGMVGGRQAIKLQPYSGSGTVIHEIGHAVGLMHEQLRADRDQYININYSNIQQSWVSEYTIFNPGTGYQIGPFDYESVMIYPSYAGGTGNPAYPGNTTPQMTRKDGTTWYASDVLSQGDINGVNFLYNPKIYIKYVANYNENESYFNSQGGTDDVKTVFDISIELYSNYELTLPMTFSSPLSINIINYYNDNPVKSKVIVPSGTHSVIIGQNIEEYYMDYGQYRFHNYYNVFAEKGVGYIIPGT
ncbi:M12 family metallopeptidase [Pedobacter miscanthi]|uniref:M12 family metallopeptidase n=1 Tax=Pedobacter miscanthi TaxID=2259170 RepID=UPI00293065B4|nr:M12 family metallopeptidase [Pedobacter miscanthi]